MGLNYSGLAVIMLLTLLVASIRVADGEKRPGGENSNSSSSSGGIVVSLVARRAQASGDGDGDAHAGGVVRRLIGSSVPECGHSCGACSPCNIQVVSFECREALEPHAEACPVGYLCICHGRAFPIP